MTAIKLTGEDFESVITAKPIVIVDFWASWCRPCRAFAPIFDRSAHAHPDVVHAKVDVDSERELAAVVGIESVPTTMAFRDGVLVYSRSGLMAPIVLEDLITKVKNLDMAQVRGKIAARKSATVSSAKH